MITSALDVPFDERKEREPSNKVSDSNTKDLCKQCIHDVWEWLFYGINASPI